MNDLSKQRHEGSVACPDDAIWWHDGLLLEAAHFQQMCLRQEQLVSYHARSAAPCNWGVRRLDILDKVLSSDFFAVGGLEAIMPDGLVVSHPASAGSLKLALSDALREQLADGGAATICLAVPLREDVGENESSTRYAPSNAGPADGADGAAVIAHMRPNLRLALASELEKQGRDAVLPLARLRVAKGKFVLDRFVPPSLDIRVPPTWMEGKSLHDESLELLNAMQRAASYLIEASAVRAVLVEDRLQRLELRERLTGVSAGIPLLRGVLSLPSPSPVALYLAWCAALGPLGILDDTGEVSRRAFPEYRHEALDDTFRALFERVRALLASAERPFLELRFERNERQELFHVFGQSGRYDWSATEVSGTQQAAAKSRILLIGLRGMSEAVAADWIEKAVIASTSQLASCREERRMGARRSLIKPDGRLVLLAGSATAHERQIDVRGLATPEIRLFAIDLEGAGIKGDLVLQNGARNAPAEVVIFLQKVSA